MRPWSWLKASLVLAVTAALVSGCYTMNGLASLPQPPSPVTQGTPRPAHVLFPEGVQVTTDPNPHPTGTYRTPEWDRGTTAVAGWVVVGTYAALIEAFQHIRVFPFR